MAEFYIDHAVGEVQIRAGSDGSQFTRFKADGTVTLPDDSVVGGGSPTRFAAVDATVNTAGVVPEISVPLVTPLGYFTFGTSVPAVVAAHDYVVQSVDFNLPNDGGAPMVVVFVELTVSNADGSEVLALIPADNWGPLSVPAGGAPHSVTVATDLTVIEFQTGADLSVSGGAIKSTAGGAFFVQVAFNFTV